MNIPPLYQVLIFLEDRGEATLDEIKVWGLARSRGILGKMEAMGLIDNVKKNESSTYKPSKAGFEYLNSTLDVIHRGTQHWDEKWRMVWFSIPEAERPKRDKLRRYLEELGFKPALGSLWISPLDLRSDVLGYLTKQSLQKYVLIAETANIYSQSTEDILRVWDFEKYRGMFEQFVAHCEKVLNSKNIDRLKLKLLIFEYATVLNLEPRLPIELLPKDWPKFRANLYYKRVRRLIG